MENNVEVNFNIHVMISPEMSKTTNQLDIKLYFQKMARYCKKVPLWCHYFKIPSLETLLYIFKIISPESLQATMGKTMWRSISIFTLWPAQKCQKLQIRGLCWQLPIPLRMQRKMGRWPMHNKMLWAICSSNSLSKNWFCNDLTSFFACVF